MENLDSSEDLKNAELAQKGMRVSFGWSEQLAVELVECSRQEHILESTPNDAGRRFVDKETAQKWYESDDRMIYSLRDEEDKLAGVIWYDVRPRGDIDAMRTFAIRIYKQAVGHHLGLPFMRVVQDDLEKRADNASVWLETDETNERALNLYKKFGYKVVSIANGRVTMVYKKSQEL